MHDMTELSPWERLFKKIIWQQLGEIKGKRILDFGSGEGITADHFAGKNEVTAIEPSQEMLSKAWKDHAYTQIVGDLSALAEFADGAFDVVFCHNVLEYIDEKERVIKELSRVLRPDGIMSIAKHNRAGRVMQMAVLLDDTEQAEALLNGENSAASRFGEIRYYEDEDIEKWNPELEIVDCFGIRTFWDLQQNQEKHADEDWQERMMRLELRVSQIEEYRRIAFFHHLLIKKKL